MQEDNFNLKTLTDGFRKAREIECKEACAQLYMFYKSHVDAGFTKEQAMKIILAMIVGK